jgi:hypothetical protein
MRATCRQESQHSGTPFASFPLESQPAVGPLAETPQAGKAGLFPVAQAVEYFLHQPIQPVGRLASCSTRLAGHPFRNFRLLHADFTLATGNRQNPEA